MTAMNVTENTSTHMGAPVTCNHCEKHKGDGGPTVRAWNFGKPHCRTCHKDGHRACHTCGDCLPQRSRWDRYFCSSTCRVHAHHAREEARLERAAWEAEHPEQAAQQRAEYERYVEQVRALAGAAGIPTRDKRAEEVKRRADRCAHEPCDKPFGPGDIIYRRGEDGSFGLVLPYCAAHRCPQPDGFHNTDAAEGRYYRGCRCSGPEGERMWIEPTPCARCARLVSNDKTSADPRRFVRDWHYSGEAEASAPRTFCSDDCRRAVFRLEARAKRLAERGDQEHPCETCHQLFTPRRADARYCSSACRQRAYRARRGHD